MDIWGKICRFFKKVHSKEENVLIINSPHINYSSLLKERQYIYLLQEREFIKTDENIYKIGKTTQEPLKRMSQYPKGSKILLILCVDDCHQSEKKMLQIFDKKFNQRKDIGREYYSGNVVLMINTIIQNIYQV